eukprot:337003-Prorocentrum_minimum.AAC.1
MPSSEGQPSDGWILTTLPFLEDPTGSRERDGEIQTPMLETPMAESEEVSSSKLEDDGYGHADETTTDDAGADGASLEDVVSADEAPLDKAGADEAPLGD